MFYHVFITESYSNVVSREVARFDNEYESYASMSPSIIFFFHMISILNYCVPYSLPRFRSQFVAYDALHKRYDDITFVVYMLLLS